jgi:hypothetical protein
MKLRELAEFVKDKELELAYGSETILKGAFVDHFGHVQNAMESDADIDDGEFEAWKNAYEKYERLEYVGIEFTVSDLF